MTKLQQLIVAQLGLLSLTGGAVVRWASVQQHDVAASFQMPHSRGNVADWPSMLDTLQGLSDTIISHDVFADRSSSSTRTETSAQDNRSRMIRPLRVRPTLTLKATAGPPWRAVVEGLPGQPRETVARVGAVFDGMVVRSIGQDTVVVRGLDTTWILTLSKHR